MTRLAHTLPPEPCINGRCFSPMACNGWGYCRERNERHEPTAEQMAKFHHWAKARAGKDTA